MIEGIIMTYPFSLRHVDSSWQDCIKEALTKMDPNYLEELHQNTNWLPGSNNIFNAFSISVDKINYILFGESPYPRGESANGYAFWDAAVTDIWSSTGLSKRVNRATSLRNIIKMLLVAEGLLKPETTTQDEIIKLDKTLFVKTNQALFTNFLNHGFLLLNASLVLRPTAVKKDAIAWQPFLQHVLHFLLQKKTRVQFILFGQIANIIDQLIDLPSTGKLQAEHPYNISFINNPKVLDFFRPLHLLREN
jgi:uracil-DNA glycosylase